MKNLALAQSIAARNASDRAFREELAARYPARDVEIETRTEREVAADAVTARRAAHLAAPSSETATLLRWALLDLSLAAC